MSTSLAEQLQRLAVPQTNDLIRDKKRPSLLFDPKEAAGLKRETFYEIGVEGIQELITKNEAFTQFQGTLFHHTSRDFNRSIQDNESNRLLNKNIKKFLLLLNPYFLLNCSHKALEWLINRYSINEYNREDLLMLILPYHESNIFVRVLQLLQFKEHRDSWYFLKQLQKPGVHLPKSALLTHAATNSGFLKFVANFADTLIKEHKNPNILTAAFNFCCTIFTGAIEYSSEIKEDQISQMLPFLLRGLNSQIPDYCASCYVIVARLVAKTTLSDKLLDSLVEKISDLKCEGLKTESCMVFLLLYQSQVPYKNVPDAAIKNMVQKKWIPSILNELNRSAHIYPFLKQIFSNFVRFLMEENDPVVKDFLKQLINHIKFNESFIETFFSSVLNSMTSKINKDEELKNYLTEIIQMCQIQYPTQFDKVVCKIMSSHEHTKQKSNLQKILKNTNAYKGKFELIENLCHANEKIRTEAITYLKNNSSSINEEDREAIKGLLIERLHDDNCKVVKKTLDIADVKYELFDKIELKNALIKLSKKCKTGDWRSLAGRVVSLLGKLDENCDWEVFLAIFPFLIVKDNVEFKKNISFLDSYITKHVLFKNYSTKLLKIDNFETFNTFVIGCLQNNNDLEVVRHFLEALLKIPEETKDNLFKYISSLILTNILPKNTCLEISSLVLEVLLNYQKNINTNFKTSHSNIVKYIEIAYGHFPMGGFIDCIENVIKKTKKNNRNLSLSDFSEKQYNFYIIIMNILSLDTNTYKTLTDTFLNYFCSDLQIKVDFILNVICSENDFLELKTKESFLQLTKTLVLNFNNSESLISFSKLTVSYLLILCNNVEDELRKTSLEILEILYKRSKSQENYDKSYFYLLEGVLNQKEEIVIDHDQIPLIMFNILSPENTKGKKQVKYLNSIRKKMIENASEDDIPIYVSSGILKLYSHINSLEIFREISGKALKLMEKNNGETKHLNEFESSVLVQNILKIDGPLMKNVEKTSSIWKLIENCLKSEDITILKSGKRTFPCVLVLNQFEKEVFNNLKEDQTKTLLNLIIDISTKNQNPEILPAASRVFKHIDLDCNSIMPLLLEMKEVKSPKIDPSRKRRISIVPTIDILDTLQWKKGVTVLEFIQDKKKMRNIKVILPLLFDILKKCLDFDEQSVVEYTKQLLLSLILHCCTKLEDQKLPETIFNMELIVQCIRASQNPQTHHHALLVLAKTAHLVPRQVLHHIMAIFTFMGSSVLRHDDAYSFQIISKIIDTIIPILVKDSQIHNISKVLRVFVDAIIDVPEHRRLKLYKQLLDTINAKEYLYLFLLLIFESHVLHSNEEKRSDNATPKRLEIAKALCIEFDPECIIFNVIKLVKYLKELPDEKDDYKPIQDECATFNIANNTPKQFRHYKYTLLLFVSNFLSSKEFVNQVALLPDDEILELEALYKDCIVHVLTFIQRISHVSEKNSNTPQAQYWKVILNHSHDVLDSLNALLTPQMFLLVIRGLMDHDLSTIRRRALELFNTKLQHESHFFGKCEEKELYALVPPIMNIIELLKKSKVDQDQEVIIQIALLSLKLLIQFLAKENPQKFVNILEFITALVASGKAENNVLASAILCLAELCVYLRAHAITCLENFIPALTKILKQSKKLQIPNLLLLSAITAVQKVLDSLPLFISPYLQNLLFQLSLVNSKWCIKTDDQKILPTSNKLMAIRETIGKVIPQRVLIPAVEKCYQKLIDKQIFDGISALMEILAESLNNLKGVDITTNLSELTTFFLNALQFRADKTCDLDVANDIESHIIKSFTVLILKLSESSFRPIYYKLFDWATRSDSKNERVITFYGLSSGIAQSLKGLFVLFAGHFLNNAAKILDECNNTKSDDLYFEEEEKNVLLLENVLKTLNAVFLYDTHKFVNKDRFEVLLQPIVDQLENNIEDLKTRNEKLLTPCICNFAVAVADDALWKQMNYQILLKMRSTDREIRLAALYCLSELVRKIGEDFLPLLPETIPFLAELLEDEEESVEKATKKAVQEMEKILGEPLQKYF